MQMGIQLDCVGRCPHCGVANPVLTLLWHSDGVVPRSTPGVMACWAVYNCTTCGSAVTAEGAVGQTRRPVDVVRLYPEAKTAHEDIPTIARRYLQQAYETLAAPDAAAVMAGSAVDAMLKEKKYEKGSLYERIDQAVADHVLTEAMGDWAHEVRLGSNRPRHADKDNPHVSSDEAAQSVEFAEALGNFLFVLTAKIERGIEFAKKAAPPEEEA
jgi:hypothetical protein